MEVSVELTLTPLQDDFETPIIEFIKNLRTSGFEVLENPLSTQIYGDYNKLMPFLNDAIEKAFTGCEHILLNMKIVKSNRSSYEPHF